MEIELTKIQTETINILLKGLSTGEKEQMLRQIVNVGICFITTSPSNRKMIIALLAP